MTRLATGNRTLLLEESRDAAADFLLHSERVLDPGTEVDDHDRVDELRNLLIRARAAQERARRAYLGEGLD